MGPTASGKSDLALALAQKLDGEIISVDSRQVYRGMDIGTGKVSKREQELVRHHLIDIASPKVEYNISHFLKDATQAIEDIQSRGKTAILCGGTMFWMEALVLGTSLPPVPPDPAFRERWEKRATPELFAYLKRLDPKRAKTIDPKNKVRLLRAIEIAKALGKVPLPQDSKSKLQDFIFIGLNPSVEILNQKIRARLKARMKQGLLEEVKKLQKSGVSWERLESLGLEYRAMTLFLQGKITWEEMDKTLPYDIIHYAKRQRSSLRRLEKRGIKIQWFESTEEALKESSL